MTDDRQIKYPQLNNFSYTPYYPSTNGQPLFSPVYVKSTHSPDKVFNTAPDNEKSYQIIDDPKDAQESTQIIVIFKECVRCKVKYCDNHANTNLIKLKNKNEYKCMFCKGKTRSKTRRKINVVSLSIAGGVYGFLFLGPVGSVIFTIAGFYYSPSRGKINNRACDNCAICLDMPHN